MSSGRRNGTLVLGVISALAAVGLGVLGWTLQGAGPADALYKTLQAFTLGDAYQKLDEIKPPARLLLESARWIGAFLGFYAVILLLWSSLASFRISSAARGRRRHLVVVGDTAFADQLSESASGDNFKRKVVQLRAFEQDNFRSGRLIRLPFNGFDHDGFDEAGTGRASRLVISIADEGQAVELALAVQRRYPKLSILTRLSHIGLLRNLHDLPGGDTLRAFSEAEAAARDVMRRHPPFLLAEDQHHRQIHALVVGDDDWVEALMVEIILTSRVLALDKPRFMLAVVDPARLKKRFDMRYPELVKEAQCDFVSIDAATGMPLLKAEPMAVTAVYIAFAEGAHALAAALELRREAFAWGDFNAPIFTRVTGNQGLQRPLAGAKLDGSEIVPFGGLAEIIDAAGIVGDEADRAERQWHEAYLRLNPSSDAAVPWDRLSEEYRLSNRRLTAHVYAKLDSAGFDLRPWLAHAKPWEELPALAPGESLFRNEEQLLRLAELEHERWNADRRLLGWRYAPNKDRARKLHPCLVEFSALPSDVQRYDIELIKSLDQILPRAKGGLSRI